MTRRQVLMTAAVVAGRLRNFRHKCTSNDDLDSDSDGYLRCNVYDISGNDGIRVGLYLPPLRLLDRFTRRMETQARHRGLGRHSGRLWQRYCEF